MLMGLFARGNGKIINWKAKEKKFTKMEGDIKVQEKHENI